MCPPLDPRSFLCTLHLSCLYSGFLVLISKKKFEFRFTFLSDFHEAFSNFPVFLSGKDLGFSILMSSNLLGKLYILLFASVRNACTFTLFLWKNGKGRFVRLLDLVPSIVDTLGITAYYVIS